MTPLAGVSQATGTPLATLSLLQIGAGWFPECCGGGENVYYNLAQRLPGFGVTVRGLVVGSASVEEQSGGAVHGFAAASAPLGLRLLNARRAIAKTVARTRPDLVASHFALFMLPALDRISDCPLVIHFHGPWAAESVAEGAGRLSAYVKSSIERIVYRRARGAIVLSEAFARLLHRDYGLPESRIMVIPGGVDCSRFALPISRRGARVRLGWEIDRQIILCVRRLAHRMGLPGLIASMVEVRRRAPDACLLIAGRGAQETALRRLIHDLDLDDTVRLTGFLTDELLPWAYRAADLTVVPSTELEGFGLITAESLAAGTPVMVTPVGGLPETVAPLRNELVLPSRSEADLTHGIVAALTGEFRLPSAEECRAYARRRFDWPVIVARTREVYDELLR